MRPAIVRPHPEGRPVRMTDICSFNVTESPVAFFIFNRPETTARVFERIAAARPRRLLVVADAPRPDRPGEAERCDQARRMIERVDWDCEVLRNFADSNLGCRQRLSSGLDWVFDTVERAIILEDDCLPDPSFFRFCDELLDRYRDDERVLMISGNNFLSGSPPPQHSYHFSRYPHIWGWASWRRAWRHYDVALQQWPQVRNGRLVRESVIHRRVVRHWRRIFDAVHAGQIDTWDYQLTFACWISRTFSIAPSTNLVSNIGFGVEATHTVAGGPLAGMRTTPMVFPLRHPPIVAHDRVADAHEEAVLGPESLVRRAWRRVRRLLRTTTVSR